MRKVFTLLVSVAFLFVLVGCEKEQPVDSSPPETETPSGAYTTLPVTETHSPEVNPAPTATPYVLTQEDIAQDIRGYTQALAQTVEGMYVSRDCPMFYPVTEDNMSYLREELLIWNERYTEAQFDPYSIEMAPYGFRVTVSSPLDYYGNPYYVWFEVDPDDVRYPRLAVVSSGEDGVLFFKGTGADYTSGGFGDDDVRFVTFN